MFLRGFGCFNGCAVEKRVAVSLRKKEEVKNKQGLARKRKPPLIMRDISNKVSVRRWNAEKK